MFSNINEERQHLLIGCVLFTIVVLSSYLDIFYGLIYINLNEIMIIAILSFPLFLFRQLAQRNTAQRYGYSTRFYLDQNMAIFSLFSCLLPFKLIAPGRVVFFGNPSREKEAIIAMAGPLTNILLGGVLLGISSVFQSIIKLSIILRISQFSFYLALFSLLPFAGFDGAKIRGWREEVFFLLFIPTIIAWLFHPIVFLNSSNLSFIIALWGGISILFPLIMIYIYIYQPVSSSGRKWTLFRNQGSEGKRFEPTRIPPKMKKKTQLKGYCEYCNDVTTFGFTCSYCNSYFCPDHRLPEKHECPMLRK
jgi:hypothetical protein